MMSPTGSAIASPPSEPSCYEDRPAEDDDVDLGVPDPVHRLVGGRDVRGAVTVPGAAFERAAALPADSTTSARALYISRTCRAKVVNAYRYAQLTVSQLARPRLRSDDAHRYKVTRSPDAADLSMAAMTSWRRTASAKSGTV